MESPVEKKKKFSSADNCLISSATISENQQKSSGSFTVTAFGGEQMKKMNKRTLKKIWICSDVLMDILPFFDRPQLGLKLALLSPRFDALVDAHFDAKSELKIRRWIKINKGIGPKSKLFVWIDHKHVEFPLPDRPLPNKSRFIKRLRIEYIDHSVITFLHANKHIWNRWGTSLEMLVRSNDRDGEQPIWDVLAREIWPIFAANICHLNISDGHHLDNLRRLISPTMLTDLDQLVSINFDHLLLEGIAEDEPNAAFSAGQLLAKWLHTPTKNGKPKELFCEELDGEGNMAWLNSFKETFIRATDASVSYQICFGIEDSPIEPFELVNEWTNEKLTLIQQEDTYWLLKRCQIMGEKAAAVQWENVENWGHKLNDVQFDLFAGKDCIGPLSPPAAEGPSGCWAQQ